MDYEFINQEKKLLTKKNIVTFLILAILMAGIPLGVKLVQEQQIFRPRAAAEPVKFSGVGVTCTNTTCTTTSPTFDIDITSPAGPPKND